MVKKYFKYQTEEHCCVDLQQNSKILSCNAYNKQDSWKDNDDMRGSTFDDFKGWGRDAVVAISSCVCLPHVLKWQLEIINYIKMDTKYYNTVVYFSHVSYIIN
jgi:hypothetical protein